MSGTEGFIQAAKVGSAFFDGISPDSIGTLEEFKTFIMSNTEIVKKLPPEKQTPQYIGAVVIQNYIADKLNSLNLTKYDVTPGRIEKRLQYFKSDAFIENFMSAIPERTKLNQTALATSYTEYFNTLFNVSFENWRDEKLSRVDNQSQCRRALGMSPSENIADVQSLGNISCYLCNRKIFFGKGQDTMECEHILPVITALSHWWLIKSGTKAYSDSDLENLSHEYAWSHRCCNQIKSNYSFIKYDVTRGGGYKYIPNTDVISGVLTKIRGSDKYDCSAITEVMSPNTTLLTIIQRIIQPIINEVNYNLTAMDDHGLYLLLTKCKVLSALSNHDFMVALVGDSVTEIPKTKAELRKEAKETASRLANEDRIRIMQKKEVQRASRAARLNNRRGAQQSKKAQVIKASKKGVQKSPPVSVSSSPRAKRNGSKPPGFRYGRGGGNTPSAEKDPNAMVQEGDKEDDTPSAETDPNAMVQEGDDEGEDMDESDGAGDGDADISPINIDAMIDAMTDAEVISFLNEHNISENWSEPSFDIATAIIDTPVPWDGLTQTFNDLFVTQTITSFGPNNSTRKVFRYHPSVSDQARQIAIATGEMPTELKKIPPVDTTQHQEMVDDREDLTPGQILQGKRYGTFPSGWIQRGQPGGGKYTKHKKYRKGKKTLKKKN